MFEVNIPNKVKHDFKRLDKPVIKEALRWLDEISEDPFIGTYLQGEFSNLSKLEFHKQGVSYRIVYEVFP